MQGTIVNAQYLILMLEALYHTSEMPLLGGDQTIVAQISVTQELYLSPKMHDTRAKTLVTFL